MAASTPVRRPPSPDGMGTPWAVHYNPATETPCLPPPRVPSTSAPATPIARTAVGTAATTHHATATIATTTPTSGNSAALPTLRRRGISVATAASGLGATITTTTGATGTAGTAGTGAQSMDALRDRTRRLHAAQRRRRQDLTTAEDDAFRTLCREADASAQSIAAFVAFRRSVEEDAERRQRLIAPWAAQCALDALVRAVSEEQKVRRELEARERRVREARARVEWAEGAAMRCERAMRMLFEAETQRRRFIARAEMREARAIEPMRPFVGALEGIAAIGQCPFVHVKDCPFFVRGEGARSVHYAAGASVCTVRCRCTTDAVR